MTRQVRSVLSPPWLTPPFAGTTPQMGDLTCDDVWAGIQVRALMSLTVEHEEGNVFRFDLQGRLKMADFKRSEERLEGEINRSGAVRLLIVLDGFTGWDPSAPWNDLSFYMKHGDAIERIAIVGPERWRSHMLMFAAADLRKGLVKYFLPGSVAEARAWLSQ